MAMTLADLAASSTQPLMKGVVDVMLDDAEAGGGNMLQVLPVETIDSLSAIVTKITNEGPTTGAGTRPIGGTYPEGTVSLTNDQFSVGIIGGDIKIDRAFLKSKNYIAGADPVVLQTEYKAKVINRIVNNFTINGDKSSDPNSFNGLKKWTDTNQIIDPGSDINSSSYAANGINVGPTNTTKQNSSDFLTCLDWLIDFVGGGSNAVLVMNWHAKWALYRACRDNGYFETTRDSYERKIDTFRGVPIVNPGAKTPQETLRAAYGDTVAVLPNNVSYGSGAQTNHCEIYAFRKGAEDGVALYQLSPLTTEVVTEHMQAQPAKLIRMDWYVGLYVAKKSALAKLVGIRVI